MRICFYKVSHFGVYLTGLTRGPFGIAIHMLRREKVDMWAWLNERWSCMCVRECKLPINCNKHYHQQYQCIYFGASIGAYKFKKNKVHLASNANLAESWIDAFCSKRSHSRLRRLDHNQNDPERDDERHGAPISFIWVECRTTNYVIRVILNSAHYAISANNAVSRWWVSTVSHR